MNRIHDRIRRFSAAYVARHRGFNPARLLRSALRTDGGVAGVELAVLLPLIMLVLLGFTEMYMYLRAQSIVERTAYTLADTIGQKKSITDSTATTDPAMLGSYFYAATLIATPLSLAQQGQVIITSICDSTSASVSANGGCNGNSTNCNKGPSIYTTWTRGTNWTLPTSPQVSSRLGSPPLPSTWSFYCGDSALAVEVFYQFNPFTATSVVWKGAPGQQILYKAVLVRPRWGLPVLLSSQL